jgi:carbamate kinase
VRLVVALGGNALLERGEVPVAEIQQHHVVSAVEALAPLARDYDLVVTHGNGPQVGLLALESARDPVLPYPYPFDVLGAQTQGMIGYFLLQAIGNALPERQVVSLICQLLVAAVELGFGTEGASVIRRSNPAALRVQDFPAGSMGPKVEAACRFVEATGKPAMIGRLDAAVDLLEGSAGTVIRPGVDVVTEPPATPIGQVSTVQAGRCAQEGAMMDATKASVWAEYSGSLHDLTRSGLRRSET